MIFTIAEVSELIGLSKVSIYKKLKENELKVHLSKEHGVTYIDDVGFNLIKDSLKLNDEIKKELKPKDIESTGNDEAKTDIDVLSLNKELFKALTEQLKIKDKQIEDKDLQIHELHKLIENSPVLLSDKPQGIKELEEHFQKLDNKLIDIKKEMNQRKQRFEEEQKKGFFKFLKRFK